MFGTGWIRSIATQVVACDTAVDQNRAVHHAKVIGAEICRS